MIKATAQQYDEISKGKRKTSGKTACKISKKTHKNIDSLTQLEISLSKGQFSSVKYMKIGKSKNITLKLTCKMQLKIVM